MKKSEDIDCSPKRDPKISGEMGFNIKKEGLIKSLNLMNE